MLKIEIKEKRSKEFYKEIINVSNQFKSLLKRPDGKVRDFYKDFSIYIIVGFVLLILLGFVALEFGFDWLMAVAFILSIVIILFGIVYLSSLTKILNSLYKGQADTVFIMDDEGIGLFVKDEKNIKIVWGKLYFVRVLKHSVVFVPKDYTTFVTSVNIEHKDEILDYLKENKPEFTVIQ